MEQDNALHGAIEKAISDLEAKGVTREQINAIAEEVRADQDREAMEPVMVDPLQGISARLDKLQASVDALSAKLDAE